MYDLPYHKENDPQRVREFINQHPFAFLIGSDSENKPVATQVPLLLRVQNEKQRLVGHIMRNTDHHKALLQNPNVLAVFSSPHTYVSGSWYENPNTVSTWNYMSVHAKGLIRFLDHHGLESVLRQVSHHFENNNADSPTVFENIPTETRNRLMKAVVAFEIEVSKIDTVFKLSQDQNAPSYKNIIEKLKEKGPDEKVIATAMESREKELFPDNKE